MLLHPQPLTFVSKREFLVKSHHHREETCLCLVFRRLCVSDARQQTHT